MLVHSLNLNIAQYSTNTSMLFYFFHCLDSSIYPSHRLYIKDGQVSMILLPLSVDLLIATCCFFELEMTILRKEGGVNSKS